MRSAKLTSATLYGGKVIPVSVEVDIRPGLPIFSIIGLPDRMISEAKERVKSAIRNSGYKFPLGHITVNLGPAEIKKQGTGFDLAIALGILIASKTLPCLPPDLWVLGQISLRGGLLSFQELPAILVEAIRQNTLCLIPGSFEPPDFLKPCSFASAGSLKEMEELPWERPSSFEALSKKQLSKDFAIDKVRGQSVAKRALEIAIAGGHHLLFVGPKGVGKSRLAEAAYQLLPEPNRDEQLQIVQVTALSQNGNPGTGRPYRAPHHSTSWSGMYGGSAAGVPGELALAHMGILFLDELCLFSKEVLEGLREPMESRLVKIKRGTVDYEYPADCLIIAACNSCPCGNLGSIEERCRCTQTELDRYSKKISGPLLERFPIQVELESYLPDSFRSFIGHLPGFEIHERIAKARVPQMARNRNRQNSELRLEEINVATEVTEAVDKATWHYELSGRGIESLLQVARTIADIEGSRQVSTQHVTEALRYRRRDIVRQF